MALLVVVVEVVVVVVVVGVKAVAVAAAAVVVAVVPEILLMLMVVSLARPVLAVLVRLYASEHLFIVHGGARPPKATEFGEGPGFQTTRQLAASKGFTKLLLPRINR